MSGGEVLWRPDADRLEGSGLSAFMRWLAAEGVFVADSYDHLWRWSVTDLDAFWMELRRYFDVAGEFPDDAVLSDARMPAATWFPGARLNYAEHLTRLFADEDTAIVWYSEAGERRELSALEVKSTAGALATTLQSNGVGCGDVVAGYLPNIPETVIAFIACASFGAVWTNCAPEYGTQSVLDRIRQVDPKAFIYADGYRFGGRAIDRRDEVDKILANLDSVEVVIRVPYPEFSAAGKPLSHMPWSAAVAATGEWSPVHLDFSHPLWIVYSSGTTGPPKGLVHSHGGVLLEHLKSHGLHLDLNKGNVFYWFTSSGWIMWYLQVAGLLVGATIVLFDGSPTYPRVDSIWELAERESITHLGASAALFESQMNAGLKPSERFSLPCLTCLGSTGSPLSREAFRWVYECVKDNVWLMSFSGGTDVATAFVGGNPNLPVIEGEMQCRWLGVSVEAWDSSGSPTDGIGELVVTRPMPSMPIHLVNDPEDRRYRESYFDTFPGIWRHGDYIQFTPSGGAVIHGRSDATINRRGVRMGTGEIYSSLAAIPYVEDCLAVELARPGTGSEVVAFVVLAPGHSLDTALARTLRAHIRESLSPRHVPDRFVAVDDVPKTLNGKKMEVPVRRLFQGVPIQEVFNLDAMVNPASVEGYFRLARDWLHGRPVGVGL